MPGLRATSVRRTVVVAVALVTGQALLCAVIGFVTFGDHGRPAPAGPRAAEPLAGPPVAVPAPVLPEPSATSRAPRKRGKAHVSSSARPARPATTSPVPRRSSGAPAPEPAVTSPAATAPAPEPPSPISLVPAEPVEESDPPPVLGEPCDDEGATGRTAEGRAVRCEPGRGGDLRWRAV